MWFGPDDNIIATNGSGIVLEMTNTSETFVKTIVFSQLQARHQGNYTCRVEFNGNDESDSFYVIVAGN